MLESCITDSCYVKRGTSTHVPWKDFLVHFSKRSCNNSLAKVMTMTTSIGKSLGNLPTPAFCIDLNVLKQNCSKMLTICSQFNIELRPHMKTHKTINGGILMTNGTRRKIVVSTLREADFFFENGFDDILYAYPLSPEKFERCFELHKKHEFHIMVDNDWIVKKLKTVAKNSTLPRKLSTFIDVDCGYHRSGTLWNSEDTVSLVREVIDSSVLSFAGLYVHCGDSYNVKDREMTVLDVQNLTIDRLVRLADSTHCVKCSSGFWTIAEDQVLINHYKSGIEICAEVKIAAASCLGTSSKVSLLASHTIIQSITLLNLSTLAWLKSLQIEVPLLSTGSTPSCSQPCDKFSYVQEMHPGNYIFYDAQQFLLDSCRLNEIACTVATRIVGHYPSRNELLIDCGFSALTKQGEDRLSGGYVIFPKNPELKLTGMTQELGKITSLERINYSQYPIGKMLLMYPYHSCATAALYDHYYIHENDIVTNIWKPCRGW